MHFRAQQLAVRELTIQFVLTQSSSDDVAGMSLQLFDDRINQIAQRSSIHSVESDTRIDGYARRGMTGNGGRRVSVGCRAVRRLRLAYTVPDDRREVGID